MATSVFLLFVFHLLTVLNGIFGSKIQSLGGEWNLQEATGKYSNLKATIPGGIYTDLMNNNIIGDVFYGYNDTETRWVAQTNWTYSSQFTIDDDLYGRNYIDLVFAGLDTFSTILINGADIGNSENMFVRYIFDVKDVLKPGNNTIEVRFISPILMASALTEKQGYTVPPNCPTSELRGECHVNQIRKMQASFAWDWGPAFPSMGIWKDVYLEGYNTSTIRDLVVTTVEANDLYSININTYLSCKKEQSLEGSLVFELQTDVGSTSEITSMTPHTNPNSNNEVLVKYTFQISTLVVRKWWPNGFGEPRLYNLMVQLKTDTEISTKTIKIGFRTIELIQDENGNQSGLNFYFKINNVPIFAKGSNQIPLNILPELGQNRTLVTKILQSVHHTNMNMLRVWGGGVYESDFFYEKADELGILIWQDFMFACAMYPTYPEFLSNVEAEVEHQVKRLSSHASIALWAGNNENEAALMTNWYGTLTNLTLYKKDYIKLYIDTVRNKIEEVNDAVIFLASSPSNGKESEEEGFLATNPQNPLYGDVHFYNYLTNSLEPKTYPIPRFASEYGYQSLPDIETWLTVTNNITDLDPSSAFMDHRQHHALGLLENILLMNYQFTLNVTNPNYYKTFVFYSQILQALSIKFETEYYRSFMGRVDDLGQGNTMGALFWQLNDVWVAPTWASIDSTGKWKMLQYYAKDFFAPTIVTAYLDTSRQLKIYIVSDAPHLIGSTLEVSLMVNVYQWSSFGVVNSTEITTTLEFGISTEVATIDTDPFLADAGCGSLAEARNECFFYFTLSSENEVIAPNNFVVPEAIKKANLVNSTVEIISVVQIDDKGLKFTVTTKTNAISLFVWLDSHQILGKFNENGFIQVTPNKSVTFVAEEATSVEKLQKIVTVTHLKDRQYL